jgi:hypothetical protein
VEWDAAARFPGLLVGRLHVVAADPPYRRAHVSLLRHLSDEGALLHLYYGEDERRATTSLLRYLVHPRFAMVCVYRAMEEAADADTVLERAAELGRREVGASLGYEELRRAHAVLSELGIERHSVGEAKLEAQSVPAYVAAEAEYEECSRLCQTL